MSDTELLQRYLQSRSDTDFEAIVRVHAGLVLGTAVRSTRNRCLAEEVMQNVFVLLAQKAGQIREPHKLAAWLHRATVLQSANVVRAEAKRQRKMKSYQKLAEQPMHCGAHDTWVDILPQLDQALDQLSDDDRDLVLLRFYE